MATQKDFNIIKENIDSVLAQDTDLGKSLFHILLTAHPADIANFMGSLDYESMSRLFLMLPHDTSTEVFAYLSNIEKIKILGFLDDDHRVYLLKHLSVDELASFFDDLSDEELRAYLKLLHKEEREKLLGLLQFNPKSAGGLMDIDVFTLMQDFTVQKSIQLLQRLQPNRELHHQIFVTDVNGILVGQINLEDLVLKGPQERLSSILRKNELVVDVYEDRKNIAQRMMHYQLTMVPVVDPQGIFLGVIPSGTLIAIIEQESSEEVYRMSALAPIKNSYFETPFYRLLYQRSAILSVLLLAQSLSSIIMQQYELLLSTFLIYFVPMLSAMGGNVSSQTSALVIQGMAGGDINNDNIWRFIRREFFMAAAIALTLACFSFLRVYIMYKRFWGSIAVSCSLFVIVLVAVLLGSLLPLGLKRLNIDPAFSAGPFLATLMDILGILLYCYISTLILGTPSTACVPG